MRLLACILCAAAFGASAQIAAPSDWRSQQFPFPLQFAPSIPYQGTEYVRFSPTWTHFADVDGFTYVLLWDLQRAPLEAEELERAMAVYFDGLMELATKMRKIEDPGTVSSISLHPMTAPGGWATGLGGRLWTWNGFSKGEALVLNVEITQRKCTEGRSQVFFAFSKAPREHPAWDSLRHVRDATRCNAEAAPRS